VPPPENERKGQHFVGIYINGIIIPKASPFQRPSGTEYEHCWLFGIGILVGLGIWVINNTSILWGRPPFLSWNLALSTFFG